MEERNFAVSAAGILQRNFPLVGRFGSAARGSGNGILRDPSNSVLETQVSCSDNANRY